MSAFGRTDSREPLEPAQWGIATAVIIGRAGSKGFPGKNAANLCGRPIVHYSIDDAIGARSIGRIIVSTDCPILRSAAEQYEEVELVSRPTELASDSATVDAPVRHALEKVEDQSTVIVILYANVPVRPDGLLDEAVSLLKQTNCDSVQSYQPVRKFHPLWQVRIGEHGEVSKYAPLARGAIYRRQDLEPLYFPDGGVIAVTRESLYQIDPENAHAFLGTDQRAIINEPHSVIDIDEPIDLQLAEFFLEQQMAKVAGK